MSNKSPDVVGATPIPVLGFGYLYLFDCIRYTKEGYVKFNQMSQLFSQKELGYGPTQIYEYFKNLDNKFSFNTITSLNRTKGRGKQWAINKAKENDKEIKELEKKWEEHNEKQKNQERSTEPGWVQEFLKRKKQEYKDTGEWTPEKLSGNWYYRYIKES